MKYFLTLVLSLVATAVFASEDRTAEYNLPAGLSDCRVYYVDSNAIFSTSLYVVRCPKADTQTAYSSGKQQLRTMVIDGVEFVEKPKTANSSN